MGGGPGQQVLLGVEDVVLVGRRQAGGDQFVELKAHEVELARSSTTVSTQRRQLSIDRSPAAAGVAELAEVDPGEPVEGTSLGRRGEQVLVGVLTVQVEQAGAASASASPWPDGRRRRRANGPPRG
jgi:hypothetical protein